MKLLVKGSLAEDLLFRDEEVADDVDVTDGFRDVGGGGVLGGGGGGEDFFTVVILLGMTGTVDGNVVADFFSDNELSRIGTAPTFQLLCCCSEPKDFVKR